MTSHSKTFQEFSSYFTLKLQAWYGARDIESTYAFYLIDELFKYAQVKSYYEKRLALVNEIYRLKRSSMQFSKYLGAAVASNEKRPVNGVLYHLLDCYEEFRTLNPGSGHPTKRDLRLIVEERLNKAITPKQWERALVDARLWMLPEAKAGAPKKLTTNKLRPRR